MKFAGSVTRVGMLVDTSCKRAVAIGECDESFSWEMSSGLPRLFLQLKAAGKHWVPGVFHLVSLQVSASNRSCDGVHCYE